LTQETGMQQEVRDDVAKQRIVALFGDSLLMDAVEASLEDHRDLGVIRVHTTVADGAQRLKSLCPDLVIVDLNDTNAQFVLPLLQDLPDVPLLCLDANCSKVISLSCRQYTARTSSDLAHLIKTQTAGPATEVAPAQLLLNGVHEQVLH
jgi:hypothetical protein